MLELIIGLVIGFAGMLLIRNAEWKRRKHFQWVPRIACGNDKQYFINWGFWIKKL